jgi:acetyl/propionyl-CoA carboxylase alpha subunit
VGSPKSLVALRRLTCHSRRVGRTAAEYGVRTTTLFTDPDARSQHALSSPYAVNLGDPSAYLDGDRIIQIAKDQGCQGIHPGYGFVRLVHPPHRNTADADTS